MCVTGSTTGRGSSTVVSSVGGGGVVTATTPDHGSTGACLGAGPVTPPGSPVSVDCIIKKVSKIDLFHLLWKQEADGP